MITVKSSYTKYLNGPHIGKLAYVVNLDVHGFEEQEENIANLASPFGYILIKGLSESHQEQKLSKLCLEIKKINPYIIILIEVDGTKKINGVNNIKDLMFIIKLRLKKSLQPYNKRINEKTLEWFNKRTTMFLFDIHNKDELDEINLIMANTNIKKYTVYVNLKNDDKELIDLVYLNSFNLFFNIDGELFDE